ncbi:terpene synthase family protein [Longispora albida]|uniref:terpene synthase family protein n=1 Tax=Longispora albida TaxID=203523 RepID=UPI00036C6D29|nr:hypothetical protein [Longispora albida]
MTDTTGGLPPGPRGLGTAFARAHLPAAPEAGQARSTPVRPIPGLHWHSVPEPDPLLVAEVEERTARWAVDEIGLYPPEWEEDFRGFGFGYAICLQHPDYQSVEHLMVASRMLVAENAIDDTYCEAGPYGGGPSGLAYRILRAHTAVDPLHTAEPYASQWREWRDSDPAVVSYVSAFSYLEKYGTPAQADRERHDLLRLHLGYAAEAGYALDGTVPTVWQYLLYRQYNNFRPCPVLTDLVAGYELPAEFHDLPLVQKMIGLAGNATTIVNDLYSYTKELRSDPGHFNLPRVVQAETGCSDREAYLEAIRVHNDLMEQFEEQCALLMAAHPLPQLARFCKGVADWVDGNHWWHATNDHRYSLPDFWDEEELTTSGPADCHSPAPVTLPTPEELELL